MSENQLYDITDGDWRVVAERRENRGEARIRFWRNGELFDEFTYPAYRVWNIAAHLPDITADYERGIAQANWPAS